MRQDAEPRLRRVAQLGDRRARMGHQEPGPLLVEGEHLRDPVGPAGEELSREPGLERLDGRARLEPGRAVDTGNTRHGCPRPLVHCLDVPDGCHMRTDPDLGVAVHGATMSQTGRASFASKLPPPTRALAAGVWRKESSRPPVGSGAGLIVARRRFQRRRLQWGSILHLARSPVASGRGAVAEALGQRGRSLRSSPSPAASGCP